MALQTPSPMWGNYTVTRHAASSYVSGRWVAGSTSELTVRASIQPATADQLQRLPEALRTKEARAVFSTTKLLTANESTGGKADLVSIDGEDFEVQEVKDWGECYGPELAHWECIAVRADR